MLQNLELPNPENTLRNSCLSILDLECVASELEKRAFCVNTIPPVKTGMKLFHLKDDELLCSLTWALRAWR